MKRRQFLERTGITLGLSGIPLSGSAFFDSLEDSVLPDCIIIDSDLEGSGELISRAASKMSALVFSGDVTALWVNELAPMMQGDAPVIAGYTTRTCLHCLAPLAASLGYYLDGQVNSSEAASPHDPVSWTFIPTARTRLNNNS